MSEVNLEVNAQFGPLTSTLEVVTRMNLAYQHLLAANNFARLAHEIEIQNADQPFGEFFNDIIGYVSGAVIMSVAALEAYINEIFVDYQIYLPGYDQVLFDEYWSEINRHTKILDKYQKVLKLIRVDLFKKGANPYQDVNLLVRFRNALVHFKPEWDDNIAEHLTLADSLRGKFAMSPFIGGISFILKTMSGDCAKWAVTSSYNFLKSFSEKSGTIDKFNVFLNKFSISY